MPKFCPMCNTYTNCTDNCTACMEEELKESIRALEYITSDIDTIIDERCDTDTEYTRDTED